MVLYLLISGQQNIIQGSTRAAVFYATALKKYAKNAQNAIFAPLGQLGHIQHLFFIYNIRILHIQLFIFKDTITTALSALNPYLCPLSILKGTFFRAVARFTTALDVLFAALTALKTLKKPILL